MSATLEDQYSKLSVRELIASLPTAMLAKMAAERFDVFSALVMPDAFSTAPAEFHKYLTDVVSHNQRTGRREAAVGPRGWGKSTTITEGGVLWIICRNRFLELQKQYRFILIVSDTTTQAEARLAVIKDNLTTNPAIERFFPEVFGQGAMWRQEKIVTRGDTCIATAGMNTQNGQWVVNVVFDADGAKTFGEVSQRLYAYTQAGTTPQNRFAFVLDGSVISAPSMNGVILDGKPQISGSFDQDSAKVLADQLKYGALPLSFEVQSSNSISATLGSQQLQIGLIAGLIGLALVALYSLIVYRALGFVIIASLAVMGVLTYITLCILAWRMGFRLSLAGVAGLIVTIGFTADSFIVYFERIRDELRDGKSITAAVEDGWGRAKRTIYISKSINILAAVVLYILADATVKGFAFTLGLTTLIDILIFILFTHPVMQLLARTRFFGGGHPLSGLDPEALGAVYRGRAQFRAPVAANAQGAAARRAKRSRGEAERRQTIAERKQAELSGSRSTTEGDD